MSISPIAPLGSGAVAGASQGAASGGGKPGLDFGTTLDSAINSLNGLQVKADQAGQSLATGQTQDVAQAVIAAEKAGLALQLAVQLRNKAVQAYQQIMQMQM